MNNNFTMSQIWKNSLYIRYNLNDLVCTGNLFFYKNDKLLTCQHFFNFEFSEEDINNLKSLLDEGYQLKFNYVDKPLYEKIRKTFGIKNTHILDKWDAPILKTDNIDNHLKSSRHSQVNRNYNKYLKNKSEYDFILNNTQNVSKLWTDVLKIDYNSWKGKNKCDMKSLNREDLQYIFHLMREKEDSSLLVCYKNDVPLAYSLMFKNNQNNMWYAVKWGASFKGREKYLGIYSLFEHLIYLQKESDKINIDFWGRRSQTYDYLKNKSVERYHILVKRGD